MELLEAMRQHGLVPNVITYNALISACGKGQEPERAMKLFERMQRQGGVPVVITYNALISACEKGKQPELFEATRQQGELPGNHHSAEECSEKEAEIQVYESTAQPPHHQALGRSDSRAG